MSDLRPEDIDGAERSALPPDLLPIHDRLTGDGARWRQRAPAGAGLADWARGTLVPANGSARPATGRAPLRERRVEHLEAGSLRSSAPKGASRAMTVKRIQGIVGALAAALIVGLIAALLFYNAPGRTGASAKSTVTPPRKAHTTPTATPLAHNTFLQPGQLPVVAQSDPSIVYQLGDNALMRSQDGGVSYSSLPLPNTGLSQVDDYSLMVSPLDANHVFIAATGKKNDAGCPSNPSYPSLAMHGGILASGYAPCSAQMVSVDGGQTWMRANLPSAGSLGGLNNYRAQAGAYDDQQYAIQTQGNRLYAAMAFNTMGGSVINSPGVRLVASDDGGVTWHFIDSTLATPYRYVCDFGVEPHSPVIYAVTGVSPCENLGQFPNIELWRSDNSGQTWQRLRAMPTLAESGLFATAQGALYSFMPNLTQQGHGSTIKATPASVMVSVDGGLHFTSAPSAGLPSKPNLWHLYGTLPDGSVIFGVGPQSIDPNAAPQTLYSWKKGQSAWTPISPEIAAGVAAVIVPQATNGQQTIIVVDVDGNIIPVTLS